MSNAIDPLLTFAVEHPDFNLDDEIREGRMLAARNAMLERFISGEVSIEDYLDCLSSQGLDAYEWVDMAVENINYVICNGVSFEEVPDGLMLPASL